MAGGREVASAYIDVNGDLSPFRKDLEKGRGAAAKEGRQAAGSFSDSFNKRVKASSRKMTDGLWDAIFKDTQKDWNDFFKGFRADSFDGLKSQMDDLFKSLKENGQLADEIGPDGEVIDRYKQITEEAHRRLDAARKTEEAERAAAQQQRDSVELGKLQTSIARSRNSILRNAAKMESDAQKASRERAKEEARALAQKEKDHAAAIKEQELREAALHNVRLARIKQQEQRNRRMYRLMQNLSKISAREMEKNFDRVVDKRHFAQMTKDMRQLADATASGDFSKIFKDVDGNATRARERMEELIVSTSRVGSISDEQRVKVRKLFDEYNGGRKRVDGVTRAMQLFQKIGSKAITKVQTSWARMDSTVRLVIGLIAIAAGPIAALGSALGGALVSSVSSIAMSLGVIAPLVGVFAAGALGVGLMVSAMEEMRATFPAINAGLDRIKEGWAEQSSAFAQVAGPGIGRFLNSVADQLANFDFGTPMGEAMGGISDAFADALNSPGMQAFFGALTNEYPAALEGFGSGFANLFSMIGSVLAGAAPLAERLGGAFERWTGGLAKAAQAALESGAMTTVFEKIESSLDSVLDLTRSLTNMLTTLFGSTSEAGNQLFDSLTRIVDKFTEWMQSKEGQDRIAVWMNTMASVLPALGDLLAGAGQAFANLVTPDTILMVRDLLTGVGEFLPKLAALLETASQFGILNSIVALFNTLADALEPMLPSLDTFSKLIGTTIRDAITGMTPFLDGLIAFLTPLHENMTALASQVLPVLVDAFSRIGAVLGPVLAFFGQVVSVVGGPLVSILGGLLVGVINGVVNVFEGLATVVTGVIAAVKGALTGDWAAAWEGVKTAASGALQALWGFLNVWIFGRLLGIFAKLGPLLLKGATAAFRFIVSGARSAISGLWGFLNTIPSLVGQMFSALGTFIASAARGIWGIITSTFSSIPNFLAGLVSTVMAGMLAAGASMIEGLVNGLTTAAQWVWDALQALGQLIIDSIKSILGINSPSTVFMEIGQFLIQGLINGIQAMGEFLLSAAAALWDMLVAGVQAVVTGFQTAWAGITTFLSTVWTGIVTLATTIWTGLVTFFTGLLTGIQTVFSTIWNGIVTVVSTVINTIRSVITSVMSAIGSYISASLAAYMAAYSAIWNAIKSVVSTVINGIRSVITSVMNGIRSFISSVLSGIRSVFSSVWNGIKSVVTSVVNGIRSVITSVWNSIRSTISSVMSGIRSVISSVWNGIRSVVSSVMSSIRSVISSVWNGIRSLISSALSTIRSVISNGFNAARNVVSNAMSAIKSAVVTGFNNVISTARAIPGRIVSALSSAAGRLRTVGTQMIEGLISGIKNMAGGALRAAKGVVDGAISGAKALLGINSPSRVFMKIGSQTGEGFAIGLTSEEKRTKTAMEHLAGKTIDGVNMQKYVNSGVAAAEAFANGIGQGDRAQLRADMVARGLGGASSPSRDFRAISANQGGTTSNDNSRRTVIEEGAIQLKSNASDERILSNQVLDDLVSKL